MKFFNLKTFKKSVAVFLLVALLMPNFFIFGNIPEAQAGGGVDCQNGFCLGPEIQITYSLSSQYSPAIYGDKIVWEDYRKGNADIYMYNLSANTESRITANLSDQYSPAIYGDKIVWQD
ncbi:MAG: hypothetical protein AAB530_02365, partial [Patescibacteria group bacterium]